MTLQFHISLHGITKPPVWRRVTVPADWSFYALHLVIQEAFGWTNTHLFMFSPKGYASFPQIKELEMSDYEEDGEELECIDVKLSDIFTAEGQKYVYLYDFGDDWTHKILLEKILPEKTKHADCIAGKGACPMEDCGGPPGYQQLKDAWENPGRKGSRAILSNYNLEGWSPDYFNLKEIQQFVRSVEG